MALPRLVVTIIILILLGTGAYFFFSRNNSLNNSYVSKLQQQAGLKLPIDQFNKAVVSVNLLYDFKGTIIDIKDTSKGTKITLNDADVLTPDFIVTKDTPIIKVEANKTSQVTPDELKRGVSTNITMLYNLKTNVWSILSVELDETPVASPQPK